MTWPLMIRRVHGHSMTPTLPPNTLVIAWRWRFAVRPGVVVVFVRDNRETIKRIERVGPEGVFVVGDHVDASTDSRHFGAIQPGVIKGRLIWPKV
jgi:nickel-type superoxide dismutase maturation protease